jgi:hypothetical protein
MHRINIAVGHMGHVEETIAIRAIVGKSKYE